jgi:hypothetical protein
MAPDLYWSPTLPNHWIVSDDTGRWLVPATYGGWAARRPYRGHRAALRDTHGPHTQRLVLDTVGYDHADD